MCIVLTIDKLTQARRLGFGFDFLTVGSVHAWCPAIDCMSTDLSADSSSRSHFRARTNRQMRLNALPHASGYTAGKGNSPTEFCSY